MSSFVDSEKNWIRARFFTFPQDYSKLVYISRDLRESFSSSFFLRGRNFNANADSVTFSGNYTPNFKLPSYPSPKKEKEEEKKNRSMQNTHRIAQLSDPLNDALARNDSFDSKSGGAPIAPMIKIPSFRDLVASPPPFRRKISHAAHEKQSKYFFYAKPI